MHTSCRVECVTSHQIRQTMGNVLFTIITQSSLQIKHQSNCTTPFCTVGTNLAIHASYLPVSLTLHSTAARYSADSNCIATLCGSTVFNKSNACERAGLYPI